MLLPSIFSNNFFEGLDPFAGEHELFSMPERSMRMDITEKDDHLEYELDLPGFKKGDVKIELQNGYCIIEAKKEEEKEEKKEGKVIKRERYSGAMKRSVYVGDNVTAENIKATFENGVLKLCVPKAEEKEPEKALIEIK